MARHSGVNIWSLWNHRTDNPDAQGKAPAHRGAVAQSGTEPFSATDVDSYLDGIAVAFEKRQTTATWYAEASVVSTLFPQYKSGSERPAGSRDRADDTDG